MILCSPIMNNSKMKNISFSYFLLAVAVLIALLNYPLEFVQIGGEIKHLMYSLRCYCRVCFLYVHMQELSNPKKVPNWAILLMLHVSCLC